MKIVGCDLHARQQSIAMLEMETGEFTEKIIRHEGKAVREFYAALEGPVVVGIEATGSMQWILELGSAHHGKNQRSWESSIGWVIRRRSGRPRPGNMIDARRA
jgi:hypothetical protein